MDVMSTSMLLLASLLGQLAEPTDVRFVARSDGSEQHYVLMLPAQFSAEATYSLLVVLHGHGSDRWQYIHQTRAECRVARDMAAKYRMILVSPDYRASTSWLGPKAEADLVQIIEELRAKHHIDKTVLCGGSMGGTAVLSFAALHPEMVDGVVSMNGTANLLEYENFQDAIRASFGGSKSQIPEEYKRRSAEYWPERLCMPIAITAGAQDKVVPPDSVLRLAGILQKLGRKVSVQLRPNGAHETNYSDGQAAFEFVMAQLGGALRNPPR